MIVGMDFGTTNSGMAVYDGQKVSVLPLDPSNANPRVIRTALYITNEQTLYAGRQAVDTYFEQNIGRPVKTKKVWIGELEVYGADMFYVTDAYAFVDVFSPGRLFLSIKTSLRDADYAGTIVGQHFYSLEDLISLYLHLTKVRAEKLLGKEIEQVVLGRPVRFAVDPEKDRLAQARLLQAAFRAGYKRVYLRPEPIAAAFSYETTLSKPQNVLTFDFGGGTLDITVMRLGDPQQRAVLATGGIPVAGDVFDQKLVRAKLPRHFGEGSLYGPRDKALRMPQWIFDSFADWQKLLELQTAENRRVLKEIAQTAQKKQQIKALQKLVSGHYGLQMFDIVERAKRRISDKRGAEIRLEGEGFTVREFVTRTEFERIIRSEITAVDKHLDEIMRQSGLRPDQIDTVIRTGGSSEIPVFDAMLKTKFSAEKVRAVDTFSSVTAGLGIIAHGIERGEIDLPSFTPADIKPPQSAQSGRPNVSPINIEVMQRRIQVQEEGETAENESDITLIRLGEREITAVSHPKSRFTQYEPIPLTGEDLPVAVITAALDEPLLVVTSKYRFLHFTARQLLELQKMGVSVRNLHQLGDRETLCTITRWGQAKLATKLLIVTSSGLARPYPMRIMVESIEAPVPMMFDNPLAGVPILVTGAETNDSLHLLTRSGKGLQIPVGRLRTSGTQAIHLTSSDRLNVALLAPQNATHLLLTADGFGKLQAAIDLPAVTQPKQKGRSLLARRSDAVVMTAVSDEVVWVATNRTLEPIDPERVPAEESSKSYPVLPLDKKNEEQVTAVLREA